MDTKPGRIIKNFEEHLSIMLNYPLVPFFVKSPDKLKPLYHHYDNAYEHQNSW